MKTAPTTSASKPAPVKQAKAQVTPRTQDPTERGVKTKRCTLAAFFLSGARTMAVLG